MANYSLVANSQFKARSFDDLLRPYAMYTQEYRAQEDAIADLATKADIWAGLANEQTDPVAYAQYMNYANDLKDQAAIMADRGLNPSSRQAILNLKRRYASEIIPIEQAYNTRKVQAEEQRKALLQNPTILFSRRADATSLDDYIKNPTLGYESYSGALLTQQMSELAKTLADELMKTGDNQTKRELIQVLPYQYVERIKRGLTRQEINEFMNNPTVNPILQGMANQVLASSGIESWNAPDALKAAKHFINQGAWAAEGTETEEKWTDSYSQQSALQRQQYDLMDRNARNAEIREIERATAKAKESELEAIANRGESFLVASGGLDAINHTLNKLRVGDNKLKASYFGKTGNVNPMEVYEKYQQALKLGPNKQESAKIEERVTKETTEWVQKQIAGLDKNSPGYASAQQRIMNQSQHYAQTLRTKYAQQFKTVQGNKVKQQYGVSEVLSTSDYKVLKSIGYTGKLQKDQNSHKNFLSEFGSLVNDKVQEKMMYSTATDYTYISPIISRNLAKWEDNGSFLGRVYALNADGSKGKAVEEFDDLNITDANNIVDVLYSAEHPTKVIVRIGNDTSSKDYIMDPNVLGSNAAGFISKNGTLLARDPDKTLGAVTITAGLTKFLNSYNPVPPKSKKEE